MSTSQPSLSPPRGMRDFYPEDMVVRNTIFDAWRTAARTFAFDEYDACVVESLDLLKRKAGEEIVDQIYTFKDKSGRDLALRPEMTPTLARMVAARQGSISFPIKWFTIAQCFRYERMTRGRKREHYQWNMDIIGEESVSAETEIIAAAVHALTTLGLDQSAVSIRFSSRALLSDIFATLGISEDHHAATFLALDKRGKVDDAELAAQLGAQGIKGDTTQKVFDLLKIQTLDEVKSLIGSTTGALANINEFVDLLDAYGMSDMLTFDISVVRGLSYYTGIVFEAYDVNREFRAILGGGRYDNLLCDVGGKAATGVGLGFGDVVIAEILAQNTKTTGTPEAGCVTIGYMEPEQRLVAMRVASAFRRDGQVVDISLSNEKPKSFFSRAGKSNADKAIYIGPDDVANGSIRIKDLATREETTLLLSDITTPTLRPSP